MVVVLEDSIKVRYSFLEDGLRFCCRIFKKSSFFMIPSTFWRAQVSLPAKQPQGVMLPPPCWTVAMALLGLAPERDAATTMPGSGNGVIGIKC